MRTNHELEPTIHDWLHHTLDVIPDPRHRYPLVAAEVNETPQGGGLRARWRARGRHAGAALGTSPTTRARISGGAWPMLVAGMALVVVGSLAVGRLLMNPSVPGSDGGVEPAPLTVRSADAAVVWDGSTDPGTWIPSSRDRLAVGPQGSLFVLQEPTTDELAYLTRLDDGMTWRAPEHVGTYNLFDLQVGPNGRAWFNGGEAWATQLDGEWHHAEVAGYMADGPLQALTIRPDGSALAVAPARLPSGGSLSANVVTIDANGDPISSTELPAHLTTDTRALWDLGAIDVAQTEAGVWVGAHLQVGGGLSRLDPGSTSWIDVEPLGPGVAFWVNALAATASGDALWALLVVEADPDEQRSRVDRHYDPVLTRFADGQWQSWGLEAGLPRVTHRWAHWYPLPMETAPDGSLWLANKSGGLVHFDGATLTSYEVPPTQQNEFVNVHDLDVGPAGEAYALIGEDTGARLYRADLPGQS